MFDPRKHTPEYLAWKREWDRKAAQRQRDKAKKVQRLSDLAYGQSGTLHRMACATCNAETLHNPRCIHCGGVPSVLTPQRAPADDLRCVRTCTTDGTWAGPYVVATTARSALARARSSSSARAKKS